MALSTVILRCKPLQLFHLGRSGLDDNMALADTHELIHSDTLFSALINVYSKLNGSGEPLIEQFRDNKVKISSAFYCLENEGKYLFFLPRPVCTIAFKGDYKKIKKIKFVSKGIWEKGVKPEEWVSEKCQILQKQFVCLKSELNELGIPSEQQEIIENYRKITQPKVNVHTDSKEGTLYEQTDLQIVDNSHIVKTLKVHFYFLQEDHELSEEESRDLKVCLNVLADTGIGGQRSTGAGFFEGIDFPENIEWKKESSAYYATLSLSVPQSAEEFSNFHYYDLVFNGGRPTGYTYKENDEQANEKLKRIRMVAEGAIIENMVEGKLVNISPETMGDETPDRPIYWRNGKAFHLPVHSNFVPNTNDQAT